MTDTWVIIRDSYLTDKILNGTIPRSLDNEQYIVRVTAENEQYLLGKKRYTKEQLLTEDLSGATILVEEEIVVVDETITSDGSGGSAQKIINALDVDWHSIAKTSPNTITDIFEYKDAQDATLKIITITYTNSSKTDWTNVVRS